MMHKQLAVAVLALTAPLATLQLGAQQLTGPDKWADSARVLVESAVRSGSPAGIQSANVLLDRALAAFPNNPLLLHYAGYALYREGTLSVRDRSTRAAAGAMFDSSAVLLARSAEELPLAETYALESAVYGQMIGASSNPLIGMTLGPKAGDALDRAMQLGPRNPRVWLMRGISAMFTPSEYGGGLDKAESYLSQALKFYATDTPKPPLPAWGHAEAYLWLGQVYLKEGKRDAAHDAFVSAAKLEPDNAWAHALIAAPDAASTR